MPESLKHEDSSLEKKSVALVKSLRKKLTENNYDYSSYETKRIIYKRAESRENVSSTETDSKYRENSLHPENTSSYSVAERDAHEISKNDLLYYIDDRHLTEPEQNTVRYKILKMKHKSRRMGTNTLIQEESKNGIAILNLGGGPIPEFRLPKSRRQYMQDHGRLTSVEDELPPPTAMNNSNTSAIYKNPYMGLKYNVDGSYFRFAFYISDKTDFLDVIKSNLRRNNDDYTDAPIYETKSSSMFLSTVPTLKKIYNVKGVRRANVNALESEDIDEKLFYELQRKAMINNTSATPKNIMKDAKITPIIVDLKVNKLSIPSQPQITTKMRTFTITQNRSKIEKFQMFFEKNKALFKEFLSSKIAARKQIGRQNKVTGRLLIKGKKMRPWKNVNRAQNGGWLDDASGSTVAPQLDPDRLDMLPAIGGRIHYRRIKGRLCHRHVLIPEGPKYDSKGRIYLPAHADKVRRPYNVTRRHKLVLPKCCNCCKKSVLGCE
ncbi:unnamed protein product [Leptosia nina]|uniref:Uncharacterized protein n=1 Tax=Leptosia nina TaxID=320188 RepID=A0AAV1JK58_9NEOP